MIKALYAVLDDTPGNGIVGVSLGGEWYPLVFTDPTQAKRELAQQIATQTRKHLTLAKFTVREDMEVFLP